MSKIIALFSILVIAVLVDLAFLYYGFGISPISWWAVIGFGVVGKVIVRSVADVIVKECKDV